MQNQKAVSAYFKQKLPYYSGPVSNYESLIDKEHLIGDVIFAYTGIFFFLKTVSICDKREIV